MDIHETGASSDGIRGIRMSQAQGRNSASPCLLEHAECGTHSGPKAHVKPGFPQSTIPLRTPTITTGCLAKKKPHSKKKPPSVSAPDSGNRRNGATPPPFGFEPEACSLAWISGRAKRAREIFGVQKGSPESIPNGAVNEAKTAAQRFQNH